MKPPFSIFTYTNLILTFLSSTQFTQVHSQAVNFTLHGNHLLERIINELPNDKRPDNLDEIYNHGCWCSFLQLGQKPVKPKRGHPLDVIDQICRSYSQCMRCVGIEGFCETSRKHYFVVNKKKTPWSCNFPQTDFCARERCECDLNAALAIKKYFKKNYNNWQSITNPDQENGECLVNPGPHVKKNRCCKVGGLWVQYSNQTHSCDFDQGQLVEGQIDFGGRTKSIENPEEALDLKHFWTDDDEGEEHAQKVEVNNNTENDFYAEVQIPENNIINEETEKTTEPAKIAVETQGQRPPVEDEIDILDQLQSLKSKDDMLSSLFG